LTLSLRRAIQVGRAMNQEMDLGLVTLVDGAITGFMALPTWIARRRLRVKESDIAVP